MHEDACEQALESNSIVEPVVARVGAVYSHPEGRRTEGHLGRSRNVCKVDKMSYSQPVEGGTFWDIHNISDLRGRGSNRPVWHPTSAF